MGAPFLTADATRPIQDAIAVTTSDTTVFPTTRALWIGVTGNVAVRLASGNVVTFTGVPVGWFAVQCDKVMLTNTTASSILRCY